MKPVEPISRKIRSRDDGSGADVPARRRARGASLRVESLEQRTMLSAAPAPSGGQGCDKFSGVVGLLSAMAGTDVAGAATVYHTVYHMGSVSSYVVQEKIGPD